jgi:5-methylcytosine-specific restriction endonuclease McrA
MQRLLSAKAERAPGHRFDDLYSLVCREDWLRLAQEYVARNAGSKTAGCDGITMAEFEADLEGNLGELRRGLQSDKFVACPVRRVYIPKANGKMRPLGIPALSAKEKAARRRTGQANYAYARYADDFVILSNGTKAQVEGMRDEVRNFLSCELHLTLSMEKTRITHLNDGFDFLGFHIRRGMGHSGMKTKVVISARGLEKHLNALRAATAPATHEDSVILKIKALNRIIAGWCRYYQHTSKASTQFAKLEHKTFWRVAHWLGRKFKLRLPQVLGRFSQGNHLGEGTTILIGHSAYRTRRYKDSFLKPNPYTTRATLEREELPDERPWPGFEDRPGWADIKQQAQERDRWTCRLCKATGLTPGTCEVDHILRYSCYKRPVDANRLENLQTLCIACHKRKTELDRQMESRMPGNSHVRFGGGSRETGKAPEALS